MELVQDRYAQIVDSWHKLQAADSKRVEALLEDFDVRFAFNSGKIENQAITFHDTRDIFDNGRVRSYSGDVRSLFEIKNQKICQQFLRESLSANRDIDDPMILEVHKLLTQGTYDENRWARGERGPGSTRLAIML